MASFYDNASIITIPSGYKVGTLYSAKPTDATGDMAFTRTGDTATRVMSNGLIERCITNVALQSNVFSNASWTKSNTNIGSGITDPNSGTTAFSLAGSSSTSNVKYITQTVFSAGTDAKTFSVYAKANTHSFIQLRNASTGTGFANFDLTNGTSSAGTGVTTNMESLANGWYRISISQVTTGTLFVMQLVDSLSAILNESSTTINSVYIWRSQAQTGDYVTNYIDTTTAAVTQGPVTNLPRLDYFGSTCPQLLMEPTRTNLCTYSQMLDNSSWVKNTSSVSGNVLVSPDGYSNADVLIEDNTSGIHSVAKDLAFVSGTTYTFSCFVKQGSGTRRFAIATHGSAFGSTYVSNFNLQTGLVTNSAAQIVGKIENYGNGWYRCSAVARATATITREITFFLRSTDTASSSNYTGDGTSSLYIWGAQVEAGAYATSYIPCVGATVTRNRDYAVKTSATSLINSQEGVLFADIKSISPSSNNNFIGLGDGTYNNRVNIFFTTATNSIRVIYVVGGTQVFNVTTTAFNILTSNKIAFSWKLNEFKLFINGTKVSQLLSGNVIPTNTLTSFQFSEIPSDTGNNFVGLINNFQVYKNAFTDAELATLTTL